jgi:hypothetical protein
VKLLNAEGHTQGRRVVVVVVQTRQTVSEMLLYHSDP